MEGWDEGLVECEPLAKRKDGTAAFLSVEKNFRRNIGYTKLWIREVVLGWSKVAHIDKIKKVA